MSILSQLQIERVAHSRRESVDYDSLDFGGLFSDHMFSMEWEDGRWQNPRIVPYAPLAIEPGNATLHYGQSVFEGLKAFRGMDKKVRIFRPDRNALRLQQSCERLCIPQVETDIFIEAVERIVEIEKDWIPDRRGESLYIRPLIFSSETHLEVRPSRRYRMLIMTTPVGSYFDRSSPAVTLKVEDVYTRSAPGGTGAAKTAGNYAASLYPAALAREEGYMQVLWLDGIEHRYIEEVGAMNIFFSIDGKIITPELRGTILTGVTRDAAIALLRENGYEVIERRITIDEIVDASKNGRLDEAFGAGTAAVISPVGTMAYRGEEIRVNANASGPTTQWLYDRITGIQLGEFDDPHGWCRVLPV
ncbi:MAG: branched-chain amino acid aminotransferase [Ectothiorhodospiraceae bacterium AqS1]|nr:branched-chain amino acid aminotransferase [Ectothiorhodospiraceae bacterium AqS1]|eukprot:XP_003391443.1 PREDICTED: uncharacterized protein LOC100631679 [Amphimedon queenslandica]